MHLGARCRGPKRRRGLKYQASRQLFVLWSWGESNPRPSIGDRTRYDHSRVSGSRQPHRRVGWATRARPRGLSPVSAVFHAVSGLSQLSPPLLLPGCGGPTPRAVAGRSDSQLPDRSGGESEIVRFGVSLGAPFSESGQLRSHDTPTAIGVETDQPRGVCDNPGGSPQRAGWFSVVNYPQPKGTAGW